MLKTLLGGIVNFGIGSLIGNAGMTLITKTGNKVIDQAIMGMGMCVIADMVGTAAQKHIDNRIDEITEPIKIAKEKAKEVNKDGREEVSE